MTRLHAQFYNKIPLLLLLLLTGCTSTRFKNSNFSAPSWTIKEGQALWKTSKPAPELAGEILYFENEDGSIALQFTKSPFPVLLAQVRRAGWQIEFLNEKKTFSGAGPPPRKYGPLPMGWLVLSSILAGNPVPREWEYKKDPEGNFQLANSRTGETISGFL